MRSLPLRLEETLHDRLRECAWRKRTSQNAIIREALTVFLDNKESDERRELTHDNS